MTKNQKTYTYLTIVIAIWGVLGYKILGVVRPSQPQQTVAMVEVFTPKPIVAQDTFSIQATYRDPFLGVLQKKKVVKKPKVTFSKKKALPKKQIIYSGSVSNGNSKNAMFFVSINGRQEIMSRNDVIQDVKLLSGSANSIKVRYHGITEVVQLNK